MPALNPFEERLQSEYDSRISTLARIKTRSVDADILTLTALQVLIYAQLEGGVKSLTDLILKDINLRKLPLHDIQPRIVEWRNPEILERIRNVVTLSSCTGADPFEGLLGKRTKVRRINRKYEFNQMSWSAIEELYAGLGLQINFISKLKADIDVLVDERNKAAHQGELPPVARNFLENQVRQRVTVVEEILTDYTLQSLMFFPNRLHRR